LIVNSDFEKNIKLLKENNIDLVNTSIDYILDVMRELSIIWQNPKSSYRIKAKEKLPDIVNFSDEMIEEGLEVIVELLKPGNIVFNLKRSIGKKQMLDEFVYSYDNSTYSKFRPLGVVSHISASNVFISCVDSLVSGIITKNSNILKIPRVDNFFPLLFMESLKEVDKKNVIYKNIQLWDFRSGNLEAEKAIKEFSDGIVIWGGEEAVRAYRQGIGIHTKLIEYGPKYSFSVIFRDKDIEKVANACALDVSMWEQAACSSPHVIFVKEEFGEKFTELLYKSLEEVNKKYPQKKNDFDTQTEILKWRKILETNAVLNNGKEFHKKGENFSAYYIKNSIFENSCMFRNVIVKTFENQQDILEGIKPLGKFIQTVGIWADRKTFFEFSDKLVNHGVYRITSCGHMSAGINGAPHDGEYPLRKLGEFVCIENVGLDKFSEISEFAKDNTEFYSKKEPGSLLTRDECFENSPPFTKAMITGDDFNGFIFSSGGTTGKPKYALYSREDYEIMTDILEKIYRAAGITEKDRVANIFIAGNLWTSFLVANEALRKIGCVNFPIAGNSDFEVIDLYLERFKINAIVGLPSIIIKMAEICEEKNLDIKIDKILYGGEHFYQSARDYVKKIWGVKRIASAGYALVDTGPVGYQCEHLEGGVHHVCEDFVHFELIDENGNFIEDYNVNGEIIITNINRHKMPVIRFKSGDAGKLIKMGQCKCGFKGKTFELLGRCDDVVIAGSTNIEFISFEETIVEFPELSSIWQVIIETNDNKDKVIWKIETRTGIKSDSIDKEKVLQTLLKHAKNIKKTSESGWLDVSVEIVDSGQIERVERTGKIKKVVDRRG